MVEFFTDLGGFDAHDGVVCGVVAGRAAEHFNADLALAEAVELAGQSVLDDEAEEILGAAAGSEAFAGEDFGEMAADR